MKQFSRENSYIFPPNELKPPIFLRKNSYINSYIFLEDLVDSLIKTTPVLAASQYVLETFDTWPRGYKTFFMLSSAET